MSSMPDVEIVTVDASNVDRHGFFCYKSKRKTPGYRQKREWLAGRFTEGLRIKIVYETGHQAGFVEYAPGEAAWRVVDAPGYLLIHCLWVVGRGRDKGYGTRLVDECLAEAARAGKHGVAMVTSRGNWLAGRSLLLKNGFQAIGQAPPSFDLLVKRLDDGPLPSFPIDWEQRQARFGPGLTVVRSGQCPYVEAATAAVVDAGRAAGVAPIQVVELASRAQLQELSPSAYGTFGIVYNGRLVAYTWPGKEKLLSLMLAVGPPAR